jgi:hypothetical protein
MSTYQLVHRDRTEGMTTFATVKCATDQDAISAAEQAIGAFDRIEVWQASRRVALVGNPRRS